MEDKEMLEIYNNVTQEQHDEYEAMAELIFTDTKIEESEMRKWLAYFIIKTYLLENNLIK